MYSSNNIKYFICTGEQFSQDQYIRPRQICSQQYNTLRPHTISSSTFDRRNRPLIETNTFVPPECSIKTSCVNGNASYLIHPVPQENMEAQQQQLSSFDSSQPVSPSNKAAQIKGVESDCKYSTIKRSCRLIFISLSILRPCTLVML